MSGAQTSPFPDYNQLMAANAQNIANAYAPERNRLFVQQATQEAGAREMTAMANASQGLLSIEGEENRAKVYPEVVRYMQSLGYAQNAPATYPGEQALKMIRARGLPVEQQFNLGIAGSSALSDEILKLLNPGGAGTGAAAPGASAPGASAGTGPAVPRDPNVPTIGQQANNPGNLSTGVPGSTGFITAADGQKVGVFPDVPTGVAAHAYQLARYGAQGINTVQDAVNRWVGVPGKDNTAYINGVSKALGVKPGDPINLADPAVQRAFILAQQPYESGRQWLTPDAVNAGVTMASSPNFGGGVPLRPVQVAGPGVPTGGPTVPTPAPAVPAAPAAAGGTVAEQPANQPLINGLTSVGGAPSALTAPVVAPAPTPPQPQPTAPPPATGLNSPQMQQIQRLLAIKTQAEIMAAKNPKDIRAQAAAKAVIDDATAKIAVLSQADVWQEGTQAGTHGQFNVRTGEFKPDPARRIANRPDGSMINDQGVTIAPPMDGSARPPTANYDTQKIQWEQDIKDVPKFSEQNQTAAANVIRINQMRRLVDEVSTGAGGAERVNWANVADTLGWHDFAKQLIGKGGAAAAQEFLKYGIQSAGAQERGDLGARGSLGAIKLYQNANPGLELQPDANNKMLAAQVIAAQANRDYTQGAMDWVNANGDRFSQNKGPYTSLGHYDSYWASQRNPEIYAAAMGAISGDKWEKWTQGLNLKSEEDVHRVLNILRRADPTAKVNWKKGQTLSVSDLGGG